MFARFKKIVLLLNKLFLTCKNDFFTT